MKRPSFLLVLAASGCLSLFPDELSGRTRRPGK